MYNYLLHLGLNIIVIATKSDKVPTTLKFKAIKEIKTKLQNENIVVTSAEKKQGINEIIDILKEYI